MYGHPDSDKANETAKQVLEILQTKAATPRHPRTDVPLIEWAIAWDPGMGDGSEDYGWRIRARVALPQTLSIIVPFTDEQWDETEPEHIARNAMNTVLWELRDLYADLGNVLESTQEWTL